MDEIAHAISARSAASDDLEIMVISAMAEMVFGSNYIERVGADLDEAMRLCIVMFAGQDGLENVDKYLFNRAECLYILIVIGARYTRSSWMLFLLTVTKPGEK